MNSGVGVALSGQTGTLSVTVKPAQPSATAGSALLVEVRLEEIAAGKASASLMVETPSGWDADPRSQQVELQRGDWTMWAEVPVTVTVPDDTPDGTYQVRFTAETKRGHPATATAQVTVSSRCEIRFPPGTPGLDGVSYWPLDEGSGLLAGDAAGDHDALLVNEPTWTVGISGPGLAFNGTDQWLDTGASILDTDASYSVAAWLRLDSLGGFATAISQDADQSSAFFLQYSGADNRFAFAFPSYRVLAPTAPEPGRWYHLTGVRDGEDGVSQLYVDGELAATAEACGETAATGDTVIGRGKWAGNPVDFWRGEIDQVHVYDRALSDGEVQQLYESGS
jgi:hypothetical protein